MITDNGSEFRSHELVDRLDELASASGGSAPAGRPRTATSNGSSSRSSRSAGDPRSPARSSRSSPPCNATWSTTFATTTTTAPTPAASPKAESPARSSSAARPGARPGSARAPGRARDAVPARDRRLARRRCRRDRRCGARRPPARSPSAGRSGPRSLERCGKPSVSTKPGFTVCTLIPRVRNDADIARENASCACFDAEYGPLGGKATVPATDTTFTTSAAARPRARQERAQAPDRPEVVRPRSRARCAPVRR